MTLRLHSLPRALAAVLVVLLVVVAAPRPDAASADDVPAVLVYSGTQAFRHDSIDYGNPILEQLAEQTGAFTVDFTEDPSQIVPSVLAAYDMVLFNSPSGHRSSQVLDAPAKTCEDPVTGYAACDHAPFTQAQRDAFVEWLGCGGGVVGIHQVMDAWHDWPEWDELVGMVFESHHSNAEAELTVLSEHPTAAPFGTVAGEGDTVVGDTVRIADEYYDFADGDGPTDLSGDVVPLLGIGAFTDPGVEGAQGAFYDDQQPMAWLSSFRDANRVFMTNLGHNTTTWDMPAYQQHLVEGIEYVAEQRPDAACVEQIEDPPFVFPYLGCTQVIPFFLRACPVYVYGL